MTSTNPEVARFRFSRTDVLRRDGLATWREVIGRTVLSLDLTMLPDRRFHSEAATRALSGLRLAFMKNAGLRLERTRELLADGTDDLALQICTAGTWIVSQRGRDIALGPGEAALLYDAEIGATTALSLARSIVVQLPREALAPMVPDLDDAIMRPIRRDNAALRLLVRYVDALKPDLPLAAADLRHLAAAHVRDLLAVALGAGRDAAALAQDGGIRAARLHAIKADIAERLGDRNLSVATVAARQGVSPRYVQALFESEGTTFSEYLLRQRLACAHSLLAMPQSAHRSIEAIARNAGFGDRSHFNRTFRRRYGVAPSDVRAMASRNMGPRQQR